jgi:arginase family enzyme
MERTIREAIEHVAGDSLSTSASTWTLDPGVAPGVGTAVRGGLASAKHLALG